MRIRIRTMIRIFAAEDEPLRPLCLRFRLLMNEYLLYDAESGRIEKSQMLICFHSDTNFILINQICQEKHCQIYNTMVELFHQ